MDKILKQKDRAISDLSSRSEALQKRKTEVEVRVTQIKAEIPEVQAAIKAAYSNGEDIIALDRRRVQLRDELELSQIGLAGLVEELNATEDKLSEAIEARNSHFSAIAGAWLKKEAATFNAQVSRLRDIARRLFACQMLLSETGDRGTFGATLGEGSRYLADLRIPTVGNGFCQTDILPEQQRAAIRPSRELCQQVWKEMAQ
jgi:hypothetical protein